MYGSAPITMQKPWLNSLTARCRRLTLRARQAPLAGLERMVRSLMRSAAIPARRTTRSAALLPGLLAVLFLAPAPWLAPPATAADTSDMAEVISVTPLKEFINEPRRECWTETVTEYRETTRYQDNDRYSGAGAVIGGITGGVIGHGVGSGHGRTAATVAGAVIGAIVGDRIDNNDYYSKPEVQREPVTRQVERCKSQDRYHAVVKRYHVVYRFKGREGEVYLPYDPGSHVRIGAQHREESAGEAAGQR